VAGVRVRVATDARRARNMRRAGRGVASVDRTGIPIVHVRHATGQGQACTRELTTLDAIAHISVRAAYKWRDHMCHTGDGIARIGRTRIAVVDHWWRSRDASANGVTTAYSVANIAV